MLSRRILWKRVLIANSEHPESANLRIHGWADVTLTIIYYEKTCKYAQHKSMLLLLLLLLNLTTNTVNKRFHSIILKV